MPAAASTLLHWPRRALLLLLLAVVGGVGGMGGAQARPLAQMEHRRWVAADDGPSQVSTIAQTHDGYLWLGTNESLFRFDGFRFVRFEERDRNTLNIVASLLASDHELWVGLRYGGVRVVGAQGMRDYPSGAGLPEGVVYGLARDRGNATWAAVDDGLARYADGRWQTVGLDWSFPGTKARAVFTDRDGIVWAANETRLLFLADGARAFVDTGLAVDWASQIAQAPDGAIWVAERYSSRLHRVVLAEGRVTASTLDVKAPSPGLLFARDGGLWISTAGSGILHVARPDSLDAVEGAQSFTARDGLSSDVVWRMHEDRDGNLWVGTNAGLDRFRRRALTPAPLPVGALNFALAAGASGALWAGPSNRPALLLSNGAPRELSMPAPVNSAMRDAEGGIWMGGPAGIWRSRGEQLVKVASLPEGALSESPVRAMLRDPDGTLWVSINRRGLYTLRSGAWTLQAPVSDAFNQRMPVSAAADARGRLWFGYRDNLLVVRSPAGLQRWTPVQGLALGHITAIAHHGERTWIGGQRGIGYIEQGRYQAIELPDNGLFDNIYAILPVPVRDGQGEDLWIHAKAGIFQLTAAELRRAMADAAHRIEYRSYDLLSGLANDPYQVLPLPTAVRTSDGKLWFSTSGGVAWIDPAVTPPPQPGPHVLIESVIADGARLDTQRAATLNAGTQRVVFDYTALSLSAPERLSFRYRLDGYDDAWVDAGRQRQAVYTGLGAGNYRFRVIALNKDGLPSVAEAGFDFSVPLPLYRNPLTLALAGVLLSGSLWMLYQINLRRAAQRLRERLEERHSERERIARELHDTLLQGVNGLMLRFQAVADAIPSSDPVRASLERTLERADQVLVEGRDRVRMLRTPPGSIVELPDALGPLGEELGRNGGADFMLTVDARQRPLQQPIRDQAYCIAHEAIINACRHAGAQAISVQIDYGDAQFTLTVADNGRGMAPEYNSPQGRPDHWGVRGMHERAQAMGGALHIVSVPDQGTQVILTVPAALAYQDVPKLPPWWQIIKRKEAVRE